MKQLCDLHIHSLFSDSDSSLENIFQSAHKRNLSCIALTDHDTIEGLEEARFYSRKFNIELIEGIELSAKRQGYEIHVLGYFIDASDSMLNKELAEIKSLRRMRLASMVDRLNSLGLDIDKSDLLASLGESITTRLHLGLYLVRKGKVGSLKEVFTKYLSVDKPAYVANCKYSVEEAVALIRRAGGLAFMAHPHLIPDQSWFCEFAGRGLDGIEINYPGMPQTKKDIYWKIIRDNNLLKSGGSDAHGTYKKFTHVGKVTVSYEWVKEMKERKGSLNS
ncbi:MAG: PHP domain-containing protein [Candidatus Omnitrophica bacterium]|nr:PHP domain-containing protein [Candidatus Omnitrophota bacterium]MBD3269429.1 PHP domain-containing protein [Candidatus Omnitrophota bacterium]